MHLFSMAHQGINASCRDSVALSEKTRPTDVAVDAELLAARAAPTRLGVGTYDPRTREPPLFHRSI
jgi:hypothetical protein